MKKNIIIILLLIVTVASLIFGYSQKSLADYATQQSAKNLVQAKRQEAIAIEHMLLAKANEKMAHAAMASARVAMMRAEKAEEQLRK